MQNGNSSNTILSKNKSAINCFFTMINNVLNYFAPIRQHRFHTNVFTVTAV